MNGGMGRVHDETERRTANKAAPAPAPKADNQEPRTDITTPVQALVESLQRSAGNAAVGHLLGGARPARAARPDQMPGDPLPPSVQTAAERRLGTDLADVRLHTDAVAGSLAQSVGGEAVTMGRDVFLGLRADGLETSVGQKTLMHELAHTAQAGHDSSSPMRGISSPGSSAEREAAGIGAGGLYGPVSPVSQVARAGVAHRKVADEEEPKTEKMPDFLNPEPLSEDELKESGAPQAPKAGELGENESIAYEISVLAPLRSALVAIANQDWEIAMERLQAPGEAMLDYQLAYEKRDPGVSAEIRGIRGWMSLAASQIRARYSNVSFTDDHIRLLVEESLVDLEKMSGRLR